MALREILAFLGIKVDDRELDKANKKIDKTKKDLASFDDIFDRLKGGFRDVGATIAGVFAIDTIADQGRQFAENAQEVSNWAARLRVSEKSMLSWMGVGQQFGADVDDVTDAMNDLRLRAQDAIDDQNTQRDNFKTLGISVQDLEANIGDAAGLMAFFTEKVGEHNNAAERAFVVDELLSDAGVRLLPMFEAGAERVQKMRGEFLANNEATSEAITNWKLMRPVIAQTTQKLVNLRSVIALRVMPSFEKFLSVIGKISRFFEGIIQNTTLASTAFTVLGIAAAVAARAILVAWAPVVLKFTLVVAAILALILIIDDLRGGINGADSAIGNFIDSILGIGTFKNIIAGLRENFDDVRQSILEATDAVSEFFDIPGITEFVESVIGTPRQSMRRQQRRQDMVNTGRSARQWLGRNLGQTQDGRSAGFFFGGMNAETQREAQEREIFDAQLDQELFPDFAGDTTGQTTLIDAPVEINMTVMEATDTDGISQMVGAEVDNVMQSVLRDAQDQGGVE